MAEIINRPAEPAPEPVAEICPKCSQPIPAEHLDEHLRVGHDASTVPTDWQGR